MLFSPAGSPASPSASAVSFPSVRGRMSRVSRTTSPSCGAGPTCGCRGSSDGRCCCTSKTRDVMMTTAGGGCCAARGGHHGDCHDAYHDGCRGHFRGGCHGGHHYGDHRSPRTRWAWRWALWWSPAGPGWSPFASQGSHAGARWWLWPRRTSCLAGYRYFGH